MTAINILGLDVGEKRIGVARANSIAKIAEPLATIPYNESTDSTIAQLVDEYDIHTIVVGRPRSMQGTDTQQTEFTERFVAHHLQKYRVEWQDETLSTVMAAERTTQPRYGIDAEAACIILEDYLQDTV